MYGQEISIVLSSYNHENKVGDYLKVQNSTKK